MVKELLFCCTRFYLTRFILSCSRYPNSEVTHRRHAVVLVIVNSLLLFNSEASQNIILGPHEVVEVPVVKQVCVVEIEEVLLSPFINDLRHGLPALHVARHVLHLPPEIGTIIVNGRNVKVLLHCILVDGVVCDSISRCTCGVDWVNGKRN